MAMEWVEGDSLRTVIREAQKRRAIPPEMAVRIIADTAAGLHAAHELRRWDGELRGIVHCDVSPHNVLIGLDGEARLVDFGVARAMSFSHLEDGGSMRGKFGYMSPEQAQGKPIDRRSDVFSLGIVLFELATGERLFKGRDRQHTLELVVSGKIPRPSEVNPRLPRALEPILLKALARDIRDRYQTAEELRQALERWLVDERILVSRAGVAQLVKRVLGTTIEQRREAIREALAASDGRYVDTLVSEEPILESSLPTDPEHDSVSASAASFSAVSRSTADAYRQSVSAAPGSSPSTSTSGTPGPHVVRPQHKRPRTSLLFVMGVTVGAAAAAGGVFWSVQQRSAGPGLADAPAEQKAAPAAPAPSPTPSAVSSTERALSIDSLPLAEQEAARRDQVEERSKRREPREPRREEQRGRNDDEAPAAEAREPERPEEEPATEVPAEVSAEPVPPPTEETVSLPEEAEKPKPPPKPAEPAEPSGPLAPLNRGAAIAALGSAASSASSCRKKGGPTGSGRATVTFSPSGAVTSVSISGKFAGTAVGSCVEGLFRRARLQPFSGGPVTLGRSFDIPE